MGLITQRHALSERGNDLYETPRVAVSALMRVETLPSRIWEPACGRGAITRPLREEGHDVFATDLICYNCPHQNRSGMDFLGDLDVSSTPDAIVTNPPFKDAPQFIRRALERASYVAMLLRLSFLESDNGNKRSARNDLLDGGSLARVHVFRKRLPAMHLDGEAKRAGNSGMAFAWFVWDRAHTGPAEIRRISWDRQ